VRQRVAMSRSCTFFRGPSNFKTLLTVGNACKEEWIILIVKSDRL